MARPFIKWRRPRSIVRRLCVNPRTVPSKESTPTPRKPLSTCCAKTQRSDRTPRSRLSSLMACRAAAGISEQETPMRRKQRGITLIVVTIALLSLLLVGGLALDIGHVTVNKARLQATADSAALAAAKVLDVTGSTAQATVAATDVFALNAQN